MAGEHGYDAVVVGAGPAGLAAAIGLARRGVTTALVAGPMRGPDHRTTALMEGSVRILDGFGLWAVLAPHTALLRDMRICDATHRLIRAPEVTFKAAEIGLEAFGYNIENDVLRNSLFEVALNTPELHIASASLVRLTAGADAASLELDDGRTFSARLVVGADGRRSTVRQAAGIAMSHRDYPQVAFTATVRHALPHEDVSTEFHTETGPFTLVPLTGDRSSIVCVVGEREAVSLLGLEEQALARELERRAHSVLGAFKMDGPRSAFPLASEIAERLTAPRVALVGEAAHIMPPIGAQGLNLGLRDVGAIVDLAAGAVAAGGDPGAPELLGRYQSQRWGDISSRMAAVDMLNRSLLSGLVPVQGARGLGLYLLERIGPLRRAVMRMGVGEAPVEGLGERAA